jgi:hypothetical protein
MDLAKWGESLHSAAGKLLAHIAANRDYFIKLKEGRTRGLNVRAVSERAGDLPTYREVPDSEIGIDAVERSSRHFSEVREALAASDVPRLQKLVAPQRQPAKPRRAPPLVR